ncbi:MAG: hypothetical protein V4858_21675 [Pseudomonadota bacterium]
MRKPITVSLCIIAVMIYAVSLFLPAFTCAHTKSFPGYTVLAVGFMGLLGLDPRWFGNLGLLLLLIASLKTNSRQRPIVMIATAAFALSAFAQAAGCEGAGGAPEVSTGLAIGGYLWVVSLLIACMANLSIGRATYSSVDFEETVPQFKNI